MCVVPFCMELELTIFSYVYCSKLQQGIANRAG
jgi:hypothetical protein